MPATTTRCACSTRAFRLSPCRGRSSATPSELIRAARGAPSSSTSTATRRTHSVPSPMHIAAPRRCAMRGGGAPDPWPPCTAATTTPRPVPIQTYLVAGPPNNRDGSQDLRQGATIDPYTVLGSLHPLLLEPATEAMRLRSDAHVVDLGEGATARMERAESVGHSAGSSQSSSGHVRSFRPRPSRRSSLQHYRYLSNNYSLACVAPPSKEPRNLSASPSGP